MNTERLRQSLHILAVSLALGLSATSGAHEGHKDDMSDAEMVQMDMRDTAMMEDHDAVHNENEVDEHEAAEGSTDNASATNASPEQAMQQAIEDNRATSASDLLGRFHPVAVHFPVALFLMAALAELLLLLRPSLGLGTTVRFLIAGGTAGAIVATLLGWLAAGWRLLDRSETLALHRWNGTAIAGLALVASWLAFRSDRRSSLRAVLAAIVIALVAQGYLGGEMVFGPNHLGILG